jgi:hypothetical protein
MDTRVTLDRLDKRAIQRLSGRAWQPMRPTFNELSAILLSVSPTAIGQLTTIYVKFFDPESNNQPYGVIWIKKSTEVIVGLALPDDTECPEFVPAPGGCKYQGLTRFLLLGRGDRIPADFGLWVESAYRSLNKKPAVLDI